MPENETEQTTEQVDETQEVQVEETQETKEETQETKEESGASLISRIKAKFTGERTTKEETGEDISGEIVKAARQMNWSDEDTTKFAEDFTNEQLKEMIPSLLGEDAAKADATSDKAKETEPETKEEKVDNSQDGEALKVALDRIAALEEKQGISETESKEKEHANFNQRASDVFDEASKEFEVFGKTDDLPKFPHNGEIIPTSPQMKARLEVFGMAQQLKEAGMPGNKALEVSMNAYKGANLSVETQRNVIKELKKREQTLGGKRVSHEATEAANLTGAETVAAIKREHGR